ncbi:DUF4212 domain-containing protein [Limnohabitans sp.]|jgi:putative solute:sodium symporter small subunit|uniref:DUF4212 domain-containing protein n=1 Tax=Limnohabitans sp. TaxID=1907725 RepID=UPI0035AFF031
MPDNHTRLRSKVRRLTLACLLLWLSATLAPVLASRSGWTLWGWPVDFWMAAQGCVLVYLLIVGVYAWLVNHWEQQAGSLSFRTPPDQDV